MTGNGSRWGFYSLAAAPQGAMRHQARHWNRSRIRWHGDEDREGDLARGDVRRQVRVQPQAGEDAGVRDDEQKGGSTLGHELADHRKDEELRANRRA